MGRRERSESTVKDGDNEMIWIRVIGYFDMDHWMTDQLRLLTDEVDDSLIVAEELGDSSATFGSCSRPWEGSSLSPRNFVFVFVVPITRLFCPRSIMHWCL